MPGVGVSIRRAGVGKPRLLARVKPRMPRVQRGRSYVRIGTGRKRTA